MKHLIVIMFVFLFAGCAYLSPMHDLGKIGCEKKYAEQLDRQCADICDGERYTTDFNFNKMECFCYCQSQPREYNPRSRW